MGSKSFGRKNYLGIKLEDFASLKIEEEKCAEYISPSTRSFSKLNSGVKQKKGRFGSGDLRQSSKTVFGHKRNLRDCPFNDTTNDQEVPRNIQSVGEGDYYFHSQSPQLTEDVFNEAFKKNLLKNKPVEGNKAELLQGGCANQDRMHAARQTSLESLDANDGPVIMGSHTKDKKFGHAKFHKNPFAGTARTRIVTKVGPTKRIWTMDDMELSKSFVDRTRCSVSHMWTNSKFTLLASLDENKLGTLQEALDRYCLTAPPLQRVPALDEILFAPFDGKYHRGRVEEVDEFFAEVTVTLIDRGSSVTSKIKNCREPCIDIMKNHPMYGLVFESFLEEADYKVDVPFDVIKMLENEVTIEIKTMSKIQWTGILYLNEGAHRWDQILREIYDHDRGIQPDDKMGISEINMSSPKSNSSSVLAKQKSTIFVKSEIAGNCHESFDVAEYPNNAPASVCRQKSAAKNPFTAPMKSLPNKRTIYNFRISSNLYDGAMVLVNFRWNYRKLCISAHDDNDGIENLTAAIENFVKTAPFMDRVPGIDEVVLAPYDGSYYRAVVKETKGRAVHVEFLDYGDEARILFCELIPLSAEILAHPIYSVQLILSDLPESLPFIDSPILDEALLAGGFVHVEKMSRLVWQGRLQLLDRNMNWSDLVFEVLRASGLA